MWLITDYHERGSIYDYLSENTVSPVEAVKMLYTAVCGLEHMNKEIVGTSGKHGMAHRDVKAKNIFGHIFPGHSLIAHKLQHLLLSKW